MIANTITPLFTATLLYLFVINAGIGVLEGTILKYWFARRRRAVWWMVAANYVSAWAGWLALSWVIGPHFDRLLGSKPLERINLIALTTVLIALAAAIVIECPFVHFASGRPKRSLGRTLLETSVVNVISYSIICVWFVFTSFSLPLNARIKPLAELGKLPAGTLYWVSPTGDVLARSIGASDPDRVVAHIEQSDFLRPYQLRLDRPEREGPVQLNARCSIIQYSDRPTPENVREPRSPLVPNVGCVSAFPDDYWGRDHFMAMRIRDLRPAGARQVRVTFNSYFRYLDAIVPHGAHSRLTMGLVTADWELEEVTVLPDGKIIFQWGGQIVIFDPCTRKLAFVASGTCPAFVPAPNNEQPDGTR